MPPSTLRGAELQWNDNENKIAKDLSQASIHRLRIETYHNIAYEFQGIHFRETTLIVLCDTDTRFSFNTKIHPFFFGGEGR